MARLSLIIAALLFVTVTTTAFVLKNEKNRIPFRNLFGRRDPFPEPKGLSSDDPLPANVELLTVTQRQDNFDPTNLNTWEQRYYQNNEFFEAGAPTFLFLAGEWTITPYRMTTSHMHTMAREFNANILYLEHRFFGESRPTANASTENFRFFNPEQAMADVAHFINHIRTTLPGAANSEFILVGGHYSASLAVWFRQSYPHLALGVWASSAPLESIVDFDQFKVATGLAFRTVGGDSCYDAIEAGFDAMQDMVDAGDLVELGETFRLCDDLETRDVPHFFSLMAEVYATMPMFATEESMEITCAYIELTPDRVEAIAHVLGALLEDDECLWIDYDYIIESDRQTAWDAVSVMSGFRQWSYLLCSQIGWFHSSTSPDQPFGSTFPIDIYHQACEDVFGESFTAERLERNSDRFNTLYGGLEPEVTNAVFVYGQHDPWSVLGRRTDLNDDAIAIVIPGAGQGNDLGPITDDDTDAVVETKNRITEIVRGWIEGADD